MDKVNFNEFHQLRGLNSEVTWTNWLVIKLDRDIMSISIVTKFGEDPIRIASYCLDKESGRGHRRNE